MAAGEERLDRSGLVDVFYENFVGRQLEPSRWVDHYLPHWTTPPRSQARYDLDADGLRLRIDTDQPVWRLEDGELRCSCLQTGLFAGPVGSAIGQHRYRENLTVLTAQSTRHLFTPMSGVVEAELRAVADPTTMLAIWLVGMEDEKPSVSGEICIVELFGDSIGPGASDVSCGVKAHNDPRLTEEMIRPRLPFDATEWHTYAAQWDDTGVRIYVDDAVVFRSQQVISYSQAVTVGLFEFPVGARRRAADYPKFGFVRSIRGWSRVGKANLQLRARAGQLP